MGSRENAFVRYLLGLALTLPTVSAAAATTGEVTGDEATVESAEKPLKFAQNVEAKLGLGKTQGSEQAAKPPGYREWGEWWPEIWREKGPVAAAIEVDDAEEMTSAVEILRVVRDE
ncbi:hypothetical protein [Chondromyces apiculatus]|uniref:Uncharacterized protein n=1 Tax=Chondromyces apiculatus DSM 436 TaxID=1192034 RepID=A0A017TGN8_9BACT|nr:hypothetical protein [Chondromyces apiculatus]EYF08047.1 Hypothetical protein CAP_5807 [Chondromyces apiculatus DSM 436]